MALEGDSKAALGMELGHVSRDLPPTKVCEREMELILRRIGAR